MTMHMVRYAYSWSLYRTQFNGLPLFVIIFVLKATIANTSLDINRLFVMNLFYCKSPDVDVEALPDFFEANVCVWETTAMSELMIRFFEDLLAAPEVTLGAVALSLETSGIGCQC
jgi:hypothetical protein